MLKLLPERIVRNRSESSPPGPGLWGNAWFHLELLRDQIGAFEQMVDEYGPAVRLWIGPHDLFLVTEPELIGEVFVDQADSFRKDLTTQELKIILGEGLLTNEGESWRRQRRLVAPSLQRRQITRYAEVMVEEAERKIDQWDDSELVRFDRGAMDVTMRIVVRTLFDLEIEERLQEVADAIDDTQKFVEEMRYSLWRYTPDPLPSPHQRRFEEARERLDEIIYELIDRRRRRDEPGEDLLYRLIEATDESGEGMDDKQLRDEVITLFLAGQETTALTVTYAWHLLARHPEAAERLHAEIDEVVGDERPGVEHTRELPYTDAVIKEAMRLYPPVWGSARQATEPVEIGEYTVPEGAQVAMPQALVHRDERWFDEPDEFRPARWLGDLEDELPRFAYFPFGGGPRICVGNHFAEMETILVVATLAKHCEFEHVAPDEMETYASITQRPEDPVRLRVRKRK